MAHTLDARAHTRPAPEDSRRVSILLGLLFGMTGLGTSAAAVAVPVLAPDLGVDVGNAAWTISLYALMLAVATPVYGRVSDLVGVRLPLLVGVALMTVGALTAALAPSFWVLVAARVLQGAGAAAVPTLGVAALNARYDGAVRGLALGRLAGMAAMLSTLGPLAGGAVEALLGWRAVMALPILGALLLPFVWGALAGEGSGARLDLVGAVLVAATSAGLVLLVQSPTSGTVVAVAGLLLMALGTPLLAAWVRHRPDGFLPVDVVRNAQVMRSSVAAAAVPASWFALLIGVPAVLVGAGWEAWQVGVLMLPSAAVALLMPRWTGPLLARYGGARTLAVAALVSAGAMLMAALGTHWAAPVPVVVSVLLTTAAFGLGQPALMATVGGAVPDGVRGVAVGVATLLFLVGGSIGSAVVAGLGSVVGIPGSLAALAVLPVGAALLMGPEIVRDRRAARG